MTLSANQISDFDQNGFLVFRKLFSEREISILRLEANRIADVEAECVVREGAAGVPKLMLRMHETDGPTGSNIYNATYRLPRVLEPVQQVLQDEALYLHHSKINMKGAIEGSVWPWHQDFGQWNSDGIERPDLVTFMIMLDEATEFGGCLHFQPGSHRNGKINPRWDATTTYKFIAMDPDHVKKTLQTGPKPIAITGQPGDAVLFHCNLLHASGHNLSAHDRWQVYFCFNRVSNHPHDVPEPRPDYLRSQNWSPVIPVNEDAIISLNS